MIRNRNEVHYNNISFIISQLSWVTLNLPGTAMYELRLYLTKLQIQVPGPDSYDIRQYVSPQQQIPGTTIHLIDKCI